MCAWLLAGSVAVIAAPVAARDARAAASPPAVEQVCRSVIQLSPGSVHFDSCTTSLARKAKVLDTAPPEARSARRSWMGASFNERLRRTRLACAQMGLDPMGAAFDTCVLDLQLTLSSADRSQ